jgi:hypothetical protein
LTRAVALGDQEKDRWGVSLPALKGFTGIRDTMPLQYVMSFLLVALDDGQSVGEYARRAGVSESVMSRHLLEPISKSPEEDNEAGELNKAQEILGMVLPADEDSALPLDPSEEALNEYIGLDGVDLA